MSATRDKVLLRRVCDNRTLPSTEVRPLLTLDIIESGTGRLLDDPLLAPPDGQVAFEPGDVLFSKLRPYLAKSYAVNEPMHGTSELLALRPRPELEQRFLLYVTLSDAWLSWAEASSQGAKMPRTSWPVMADFEFAVPSLEEQRRVTAFLDEQVGLIEAVVDQRHEQASLLREWAASCEETLVWNGLDSTSSTCPAPMPQVNATPAQWRWVRNKNHLVEARELSADGSEELLSVSHITGVTRRVDKNVNMFLAETNEGYVKVSPGDLVINTMWAWMGALGVSPLEGIVSPAYGVYRPRNAEDFVADYFDALYRSPAYVSEMTRFSTGVWSSRLRLYPEVFLSLPVVAPPSHEQQAIARRIRQVRDSIVPASSLLDASVLLLNERKRALITRAVTGQLDLTTMSDRAGKVAIA